MRMLSGSRLVVSLVNGHVLQRMLAGQADTLCSSKRGRIQSILSTSVYASGQGRITILSSFLSSRSIQRWRFWTNGTSQHTLNRLLRNLKKSRGNEVHSSTGNVTHTCVFERPLSPLL